jgi:RecB family exonuclease
VTPTVILLAPSMAAAIELPRRLASTGRALALHRFPEPGRDHYRSGVRDLARAVAEPTLLGRGLRSWDGGHDARLAARLMAEDEGGGFRLPADVPRGPVAAALGRTLAELRQEAVAPERLEAVAAAAAGSPEDGARLQTLARLYRRFEEERAGRVADPATVLEAAIPALETAAWLRGAEVLIVEDLELDGRELAFLAALARRVPVRRLARARPASLEPSSFGPWAEAHGIAEVSWEKTILAPLTPADPPAGLARLRTALFEPSEGPEVRDGSVELITAPGEAGEARAIARRLLRAAAEGVPFEEMGVILARADRYAPLFTDLFDRLGIPHQLHPSLPLRFGLCARSLLLLFRCRGLARPAVMEFLTFAPVPFATMLPGGERAWPSRWDALSRDARIVSGLDRWIVGLRAHAEAEREAAERHGPPERRERRLRRARDAESLLEVVQTLSAELDALSGAAPWPEWSERLRGVCDRWIRPPSRRKADGTEQEDREREAVLRVVDELASLGVVDARGAPWDEVEAVIEARFERRRLPLEPAAGGAVHIGALDAMAGLPFRVVAIPGLVEGGYPGVVRPDPFLLDAEREAMGSADATVPPRDPRRKTGPAQLALFAEKAPAVEPVVPRVAAPARLATTQDRLLEARRLFTRAVAQASERLVLTYPRADPRTGRERLPSLFLVAAASALAGEPLTAARLERWVSEDEPATADDAIDAGERDRLRVREGGKAAADTIAAGSLFFRQSRFAVHGRWRNRLSPWDGLLTELPAEARKRLDPVSAEWPVSASRLAVFSACGFQYLLKNVLGLEPALEPEERRRLEPLEKGDVFHRVAERFLRERRERGELPVVYTEEARDRLLEMAEEALGQLVEGSPPRFTVLWERARAQVRDLLLSWLAREAGAAERSTPAHFEVSFGMGQGPSGGEPHRPDPLRIDLGDGRALRISGKMDRIDRRRDGRLVLRDYKTGRAPKDEGGIFKGGKQLQVPFYILAAAELFPDTTVAEAFLDYVDGGRLVSVDPGWVRSPGFRELLKGLVDAIGQGIFVQEPSACPWCDYTQVCGPRALLETRLRWKRTDPVVQRVLKLRELG